MELALLPPIILAIAEQRSLDAVLSSIATAVASQPDVALARVWLRDTDRSCPVCARHAANRRRGGAAPSRQRRPLRWIRSSDWSRVDGTFHRIPLSMPLKIAHIAKTGEPIRIDRLDQDDRWVQVPRVGRAEATAGLRRPAAGLSRRDARRAGSVSRVELDDRCWEWLRTLSDAAAVAVKNARALEEAESLRRALELERDYLREEVREGGAFGEILGRSPRSSGSCGTSTPSRPPTRAC